MGRLTEWKDGLAVSVGCEVEEDYYSEREKLAQYEDIGELEELVKVVRCGNCAWHDVRVQKCSCCKRNRGLKDNYTPPSEVRR